MMAFAQTDLERQSADMHMGGGVICTWGGLICTEGEADRGRKNLRAWVCQGQG